MVKAIVEIDREANEVLNILKAQYGLKDKSQAINVVVKEYKRLILESKIRPEYIERMGRIRREQITRIGSMKDFKKRYGLKRHV